MARRRRRRSAAYGGGVRGAGWRTVMNDSVKKLPCYDPKLQVRRTDTPVCTASRCQPGAAPPARRPQRHRRPPSTLDRPRRAGPPATQEAVAITIDSARRRCPSLPVCTASRCQPGAAPPARRPQHHRRPPSTLDRPRRAGPPATQEAVARTSAPPSPRCVRRPPPWRRASKAVLVQHLRHARAHRAGRDPDFGLAPLEF